jgi:hypothetical protein
MQVLEVVGNTLLKVMQGVLAVRDRNHRVANPTLFDRTQCPRTLYHATCVYNITGARPP